MNNAELKEQLVRAGHDLMIARHALQRIHDHREPGKYPDSMDFLIIEDIARKALAETEGRTS